MLFRSLMGFSPVADEINLSYNPREAYEALEVAAGIPLLVGSSEDELAVFCAEAVQDITLDNLPKRLEQVMDGMKESTGIDLQALLAGVVGGRMAAGAPAPEEKEPPVGAGVPDNS